MAHDIDTDSSDSGAPFPSGSIIIRAQLAGGRVEFSQETSTDLHPHLAASLIAQAASAALAEIMLERDPKVLEILEADGIGRDDVDAQRSAADFMASQILVGFLQEDPQSDAE